MILLIISVVIYLHWMELPRYYECCETLPEKLECHERLYLKKKRVNSYRPVIITLTTTPKRIKDLAPTLSSLFRQSRRVDSIYLNLPYETLRGEKYCIPEWLKKLKTVKIRRIRRDWGPATKLLPTLHAAKDEIIIVIDDDVIYGSSLVEYYLKTFYREKEKKALTVFGSNISNGKIQSEWPSFFNWSGPQEVSIVKGHNSFLVTREMFPPEVFKYSNAPPECLWVDDVWWSGWLHYNGIPIHAIGCVQSCLPVTILGNREGLCNTKNSGDRNNNIAIRYFQKHYGIFY